MKFSIFFLALFHSVMTFTQEPGPIKYNFYNASLCAGDGLSFGNKKIKFKKIISDSRCPKGVTCVWAGEIKVLIEFFENGEYRGDKIITGSNISIAEFFNVKDLDIRGFVVSPYPSVSEKITPKEYMVTIRVSERVETN